MEMGGELGSRLKPRLSLQPWGVSMCLRVLWGHQDTQGWRLSLAKARPKSLVRPSSIKAVSYYLDVSESNLKIYFIQLVVYYQCCVLIG